MREQHVNRNFPFGWRLAFSSPRAMVVSFRIFSLVARYVGGAVRPRLAAGCGVRRRTAKWCEMSIWVSATAGACLRKTALPPGDGRKTRLRPGVRRRPARSATLHFGLKRIGRAGDLVVGEDALTFFVIDTQRGTERTLSSESELEAAVPRPRSDKLQLLAPEEFYQAHRWGLLDGVAAAFIIGPPLVVFLMLARRFLRSDLKFLPSSPSRLLFFMWAQLFCVLAVVVEQFAVEDERLSYRDCPGRPV